MLPAVPRMESAKLHEKPPATANAQSRAKREVPTENENVRLEEGPLVPAFSKSALLGIHPGQDKGGVGGRE